MSDIPSGPDPHGPQPYGTTPGPEAEPAPPPRKEPLWERVLFMILFGVVAHALVWIFLASCLLQLVVFAVDRKPNEELTAFMRSVLGYIGVTLAYLGFLQDERPFPFSPFPGPLR